jgi:macrolide phosphotransferase
MAKSPLILAALAKDAVPQLNFVQAMPLSLGHAGQYDAAVLTSTDGTHYVVRQANSEAAALELDTELVVLRALAPFRSHFPFEITKLIGETKDDRGKRVQVFSYVYGEPLALLNQPATSPLASSLANTFAAIHSLPLSVVENNGLPTFTPENIIR